MLDSVWARSAASTSFWNFSLACSRSSVCWDKVDWICFWSGGALDRDSSRSFSRLSSAAVLTETS